MWGPSCTRSPGSMYRRPKIVTALPNTFLFCNFPCLFSKFWEKIVKFHEFSIISLVILRFLDFSRYSRWHKQPCWKPLFRFPTYMSCIHGGKNFREEKTEDWIFFIPVIFFSDYHDFCFLISLLLRFHFFFMTGRRPDYVRLKKSAK